MNTETTVPETINPDEFNGWVNRETWACALHLSNDHALYLAAADLCSGGSGWQQADRLESWVRDQTSRHLFPDPQDDPDPWAQLWLSLIADTGSLWRVCWYDVAASFGGES